MGDTQRLPETPGKYFVLQRCCSPPSSYGAPGLVIATFVQWFDCYYCENIYCLI
jgi:hypothetical protein